MKIKLFVTDLDGTLLGMNHYINDTDKKAISDLAGQGVEFAVASGRMDHEISAVLEQLGCQGHRVSQNGAFVYQSDGTQLNSSTFDTALAKKVFEDIIQEPLVTTVSTADKTYSHQHNEWIDVISAQLFHEILIDPELANNLDGKLEASKITVHGKEHAIMALQKKIAATYGSELDCFVSHETCVDLVPKGINKGNALHALVNAIGLKPDEIAVIGDSFNDIPMFQISEHSYAMRTAHPDVQKEARHVVDHVYEAIDDLKIKQTT
ncbi:HAD family hydrolase [Thalassobacillus pellis]|uniref:HAD family hydrolase n=1 Tax=Thalassobacillus pellis TaxID=748008 RepID=UPI00195F9870|nr:HAD family hydrolase [Thalassobacillus pellis]MBM7553834.1 Cof subfamily protein (haloacid dehalogenase superfamily) [Thalassobacillus pellis]